MSYLPIADYGLIGDMHTAALVGLDGSIDWLCLPHFDSPSVFARILDDERGGSFRVRPVCDDVTEQQRYWPDTNVLVTRFLTEDGAAELTDFMPVGEARDLVAAHEIVRRLRVMRGTIEFEAVCRPAFDYARVEHDTASVDGGVRFTTDALSLIVESDVPLTPEGPAAVARFTLRAGESVAFRLRAVTAEDGHLRGITRQEVDETFRSTVDYWRRWIGQIRYEGRWQEIVRRSALALKLMTFEPTGAIVAAPTCSLPERVGGQRNWDYRYSWTRDSAFTIYALLRLGFTLEAERYIAFLARTCRESNSEGRPLDLLYSIHGERHEGEVLLEHLDGYRGSRPVRIGNDAAGQSQLDVYGEFVDAVYLYDKYGAPISLEVWELVQRCADWVVDHWEEEDHGIWEVRGRIRHFVHSKLMCWVALDRALAIAERRSLPADVERWRSARDRIHVDIRAHGWSEERGAFVQSYGSHHLDASLLMMPLVLFLSPVDELVLSTIAAIDSPPREGGLVSDHLVFRYDPEKTADGLTGEEGTFNICTFWLVEALTRAGRHDRDSLERARFVLEHMFGVSNHLGLFAEQTGRRGEALGNFPQAFTHLSLISATVNLDRALTGHRSHP